MVAASSGGCRVGDMARRVSRVNVTDDFRGRGWVISSGKAHEQLTRENVMLTFNEHAVISADGKTKLLACG